MGMGSENYGGEEVLQSAIYKQKNPHSLRVSDCVQRRIRSTNV